MLLLYTVLSDMEDAAQKRNAAIHTALVQLAQGDANALAVVYEQSKAAVFGTALAILRSRPDAEDILHDTYIQIYRMAHRYNQSGRPLPWILAITQNLARMKLRKKSSSELPQEELELPEGLDPTSTAEDRMVLQTALQVLEDAEREIVMLHAVAGFKHREIARLMGISLPAAVSKYHRAIKKLSKSLQEVYR